MIDRMLHYSSGQQAFLIGVPFNTDNSLHVSPREYAYLSPRPLLGVCYLPSLQSYQGLDTPLGPPWKAQLYAQDPTFILVI